MPPTRRLRAHTAVIWATLYVLVIAIIGFWPTPVDRPLTALLARLLTRTERWFGLSPERGYQLIEFTANIALFIPLGLLAGLAFGLRRVWLAIVCGFALSCLVEFGQWWLLPARYPSGWDILANTIGATLGALIALVSLSRTPSAKQPPQPVE